MSHPPLTIEQLRDYIHRGESRDPIVFLEAVMNGQDPRKISKFYELIMDIHEFSDGKPSEADWKEVVESVSLNYKYSGVSISESHSAAVTLANYLHPKRKQVEISGMNGSNDNIASAPLTEEDIELFKERFNDEF